MPLSYIFDRLCDVHIQAATDLVAVYTVESYESLYENELVSRSLWGHYLEWLKKILKTNRYHWWFLRTGFSLNITHWAVHSCSSCYIYLLWIFFYCARTTYSQCVRFESQLRHRLSSLMYLVVFISPSWKMLGLLSWLGHCRFLRNPFPFTYMSSYHSMLHTLYVDSIVKYTTDQIRSLRAAENVLLRSLTCDALTGWWLCYSKFCICYFKLCQVNTKCWDEWCFVMQGAVRTYPGISLRAVGETCWNDQAEFTCLPYKCLGLRDV